MLGRKHDSIRASFEGISVSGVYRIVDLLTGRYFVELFMSDKFTYGYNRAYNEIIVEFPYDSWNVLSNKQDEMAWTLDVVDNMRFTKRISKWYRKHTGYKLPAVYASEAGNIARNHTMTGVYEFDIEYTRDLTWKAGDWNDDGSCYWKDMYKHARGTIKASGGGAILMRKNGRPVGRAWYVENWAGTGGVGVFNCTAYDNSTHDVITNVRLAELLNTVLGFKRIDRVFRYIGSTPVATFANSRVWVNAKHVAVLHNDDNNPGMHDWTPGMWDGDVKECYDCGEEDNPRNLKRTPEGEWLCEYCWRDLYTYCQHCRNDLLRTEAVYDAHFAYLPYCPTCFSQHGGECEHCGEEYFMSHNCEASNTSVVRANGISE